MAAPKRQIKSLGADDKSFLGVTNSAKENQWIDRLDDGGRMTAMAMAQNYGLPEILGRVLAGRGVLLEETESFLNPTLKNLLPDPSLLIDMDKGAVQVAGAIKNQEKIAIFGDYDVDGAVSSSLLALYADHHQVDSQIYIPDRIFEGYGPNENALNQLIDEGAKLIITVDCGTVSHGPFAAVKERGVDIVVVDHHLASEDLPDVAAIINPNRQDDLSEQGHLAAGGVVFLLLVAITRHLRKDGFYNDKIKEPDLLQLLDLVAMATICDVVPLKGVNRAFVKTGLKVMARRSNTGLKALGDASGLDQKPTPYHLGFMLGPRINAGGRIGDSGLGARLLSTKDELEAGQISETLNRLNKERQAQEAQMLEEALIRVDDLLERDENIPFIMLGAETWHKGLVGLVSARLTERFRRPSCVLSITDGIATGSLRSVPGVDIGALVQQAAAKDLLIKGGGHAMAAGLSVAIEKQEALNLFMIEEIAKTAGREKKSHRLLIDGALTPASATLELMDQLEKAGPYGMGHPNPRFVFPSVLIKYVKLVGANHLKCDLEGADGRRISSIAFRAHNTPLGDLLEKNRGGRLHLAGRLTRNKWGGRETVEFMIEDGARPV